MNLTRKLWPGGWNPSQDATGGSPEALLRMDNLTLDDEGIVSLVKGQTTITAFGSEITALYSRTLDSTKYRYVAFRSGQCVRSTDDFATTPTEVFDDGFGNGFTAFGQAYGQILACSGSRRKKDDGTNVYNLGVDKPTGPPALTSVTQPTMGVVDFWQFTGDDEGSGPVTVTNGSDYAMWSTDGATFRASAFRFFLDGARDLATLPNGRSDNVDDDLISFNFRCGDTKALKEVRLEFLLYQQNPTPPPYISEENYFYYTWINDQNSPFKQGINAWTNLKARRGDFVRAGATADWWDRVYGVRVTIIGYTDDDNKAVMSDNIVNEIYITGGQLGALNGLYEYAQVNVYDTGAYQAKSPAGPIATEIFVQKGYITVLPNEPTPGGQVNQVWIYRRSKIPNENWPLGLLDKFYRVLVIKRQDGPPGTVEFPATDDTMSDEDALKENIPLNENLISVQDVAEDIIGIEGVYFDRVIYLTESEVLLSEPLNPDAIDPRFSMRMTGSKTDKNLWIAKVENGVLVVGTSSELYTVSGSLTELPDGTIDATIKPLGEPHPPIARDFAKNGNVVFYIAEDGWRATSGGASELLSYPLRSLFAKEVRHEFPYNKIYPNDNARPSGGYPCAIANGELFTSCPTSDGKRWVYAYDLAKKYWHPIESSVTAFFAEDDGVLLAGNSGSNRLTLFNEGTGGVDGTGYNVELRTVYDDNGQPRNRKDVFTFKMTAWCDVPVEILIGKNGGAFVSIGSTSFDSPETEKLITIAETVGLGKDYAVKLRANGASIFKLWNFTIEYEPRPEQLTYIRIPYNNLGTQSRKRFINYAFVIDTLGVDCEFFPLIDGAIAGSSSIVNLDRKGTYIHYFVPSDSTADEYTGTDIGGIICGFFEYYSLNPEEIISEKLPVPTKFLIIPANDYGVPNRKRHSSYKFQINTRGKNVQFTPKLDGTWLAPATYNTTEKRTVEYFFATDTVAIDIGGTLRSLEDTPFEFYGVIKPQEIEVLPPRLKEFWIPENNYGIAARKRIRTMPMEINTNGYDVLFTPYVDGVYYPPTTINTGHRQTAFHYFTTDVFGVDFSGELTGANAFEFYGLLKPENVEVLPVGKKFDQLGPVQFDKIAKILALRIRAIFSASEAVPIKIITDSEATAFSSASAVGEYSTTLQTVANVDDVYEIKMPKTVKGTVMRLEIGPATSPFHRYEVKYKANLSGMDTDSKWVEVK